MKQGVLSHLFGAAMVFFLVWMMLASAPSDRISRACMPVEWTGSIGVSLSALLFPQGQEKTQSAFDSMQYGCEYSIWRLFYEEEFVQASDADAYADQPLDEGEAAE